MKKEGFGNRKKAIAFLALMLAGLMLLSGCSRSADTRYMYAQELLAMGEYEAALYEFEALGEYWDSGKLVLYVSGLMALESGDYSLAQTNFENLGDFKNSELYYRYVEAKHLEQEEDYPAAQNAYQALGSFRDSVRRMESCTAMIPQKAYEAAQALYAAGEYQKAMEGFLALNSYSDSRQRAEACQQAILSQEYQAAQNLFKRKDYAGALEMFAVLGSYRDSAMLADNCRLELYKAAEAAQKAGGFEKVQEAIAMYEALDTYADAARRAQDLRGRYDINLKLRGYQEGWQYVALGTYPQEAGGGKSPILWRVLSVENGTALLLSDKILDAAAMETGTSFSGYPGSSLQTFLNGAFSTEAFSTSEQAAILPNGTQGKVFLLAKEDTLDPALGFSGDADRQCQGTAYALAKGLHASTSGSGWWWVNTPGTGQNCQAIVYYNGAVYSPGLRFDDAQTGVRPAIRLKLDTLFFTKGTGTSSDPFRE